MTKRELLARILSGEISRNELRRPVDPVGVLNADKTIRARNALGVCNYTLAELEAFTMPAAFLIDDIKPQ